MLRTRAPEVSLWETVLPDEVLRLPEELARVVAPFAPFLDPRVGCPSTPMEVYVRLIFLKFRYRWATTACAGRWPTRSSAAVPPDPAGRAARASDAPSRHRQLGGHGQSPDRL